MLPVLTYHAALVDGPGYDQNDHVALREDLALIARLGLRVVPLQWAVDALLGRRDWHTLRGAVALSCDDGTAFDLVRGRVRGQHGPQPSLLGVLEDWIAADPVTRGQATMTGFVIASPEARAVLDRDCLEGAGDLDEGWWASGLASPHWTFGNHSWDHNHPALPPASIAGLPRGGFDAVDDAAKAAFEITQAQQYLAAALGRAPSLFAYPFGHVPAYLRDDWLPAQGPGLGLDAAFGTDAAPLQPGAPRWALPRYVCRWHWRSPGELEALLRATALAA